MSAISLSLEETGGRTIDLTNREYQLRGRIGTATVDETGATGSRARPGRHAPSRCGTWAMCSWAMTCAVASPIWTATGEVVGGIAIMSQGQNVLAVTRALNASV